MKGVCGFYGMFDVGGNLLNGIEIMYVNSLAYPVSGQIAV